MSKDAVALKARMPNPVMMMPAVMTALQGVGQALPREGRVASANAWAQLRASQLNGCSVCVGMHTAMMKRSGETEDRLFAVSAWRDSPLFSAAERAALDLAEAMTRLSERPDPVPEAVWNEAAKHYTEAELAILVVGIATINAWNRINVTTRQVAGDWIRSFDPEAAKEHGGEAAKKWVEAAKSST
jgi:AhpD family alkylhydroperoxidase